MNIKILDCTLRDGGYYNNWDFNQELINQYLNSMKNSSIDVVELGFRSPPKKTFSGPYLFTTDEYINQLNLPEGPMYGVMINAMDYIEKAQDTDLMINKLFKESNNSKIDLVRIAINFKQTNKAKHLTKKLKSMGYKIGLNMMQADGKFEDEYIKTAELVNSWNTVDVLYFADSLGNMNPRDVEFICKSLKKGFEGNLGIHTHNNKNMALINSITAIENGITWCDGTVTGMGRGAGNVSTESLILEMSNYNFHNGDASKIQHSVEDFTILKNKYGWGSNLYYHYACNHNIHPTYVQSLLKDKRYDNKQVLAALEFLSDKNATSFSTEAMRKAIYGDQIDIKGSWDATDWLKGKDVLIVGAGPSVSKYKKGIKKYIKKTNPAVLFLNINRYLDGSLGKATIVSHPTRAIFDAKEYQNLNHPIILPSSKLGGLLKGELKGLEILDYGLSLQEDTFEIEKNNCKIEWPLAIAYALAIITQGNANNINLVGFDGYNADDPRQEEMNDIFYIYSKLKNSLPISSLTPTTYRINRSSIYLPSE